MIAPRRRRVVTMRARDGDADHDSSAMNQSIRRAFGKCPTSPPDWTGRHDRDALVQRGSRAGEIEQFRRDERMAQPMQHLPRAEIRDQHGVAEDPLRASHVRRGSAARAHASEQGSAARGHRARRGPRRARGRRSTAPRPPAAARSRVAGGGAGGRAGAARTRGESGRRLPRVPCCRRTVDPRSGRLRDASGSHAIQVRAGSGWPCRFGRRPRAEIGWCQSR